jgi:hypothetical protein
VSQQTTDDWQQLFARCAPETAGATVVLHMVRRGGEPLLLLPGRGVLAARSLALYPAQTGRARAAKTLLQFALRLGFNPGLEKVRLRVAVNDAFANFLSQTAGQPAGTLPNFAMLAGNPRTPGRRFVLLLFGADGRPAAVVKAGGSEAARQLLAVEEELLQAAPRGAPGLPKLRGTFHARGARAFALDFFPGSSPKAANPKKLGALLGAWLATDRRLAVSELGAWRRLVAAGSGSPLPGALTALAEARIHPALTHGDFAPWNVKVTSGHWTVLDWERGELAGVPGWDWLHFVMQPALLVRRERTEALLARLEQLLASADFLSYARVAGIGDQGRALALAYLAGCTRVTRQTEGREQLHALERAAMTRWFPAAC